VVRLARREEARLARRPGARSSEAMLQRLSSAFVFLETGKPSRDPLGHLALEKVGLHVTRFLARNWGSERERGVGECVAAVVAGCDIRDLARWTRHERQALERWAPLVCAIPGFGRWSPAERRSLAAVIRAKGGRRESDYVRAFDRHAKLRAGILALASGRARIPAPPAT
jgi:hypothetical protein